MGRISAHSWKKCSLLLGSVFDRFHVTKPINEELNKIRKLVLVTDKGSKFILLKNGEDLTEEEKVKLEDILSRSSRLRNAYQFNGKKSSGTFMRQVRQFQKVS